MGYKITPVVTHVPVDDVRAFIKRQLTEPNRIIVPPSQKKASPPADHEIPITPRVRSFVNNALEVYDGSIDIDSWLNLATTTVSDTNKVERVLSEKNKRVVEYLHCIGLPANNATCGLLFGKIKSMRAICILRQLYLYRKTNSYKNWNEFRQDAFRLNHYTQFTETTSPFAEKLAQIIDASEVFEEVPTAIFSAYLPINNVVHAKRIFKGRVKRIILLQFYNVLRFPKYGPDYALHFCIGFLSRLYFMDMAHPYWTEATCQRPLRHMIRLYQKVIETDYDFVYETFPIQIDAFLSKKHFHIEPLYALYTFRLIYQAAIRGKRINEAIDILSAFQMEMGVELFIDAWKLKAIYNDLPHYNLQWANRYLESIVMVRIPDVH